MIERKSKKIINNVDETFKVLLVSGPRQVGKTTLLKSLMKKDMNYISLDDEIYRNQARKDPKLFLQEHPAPLFIDEAQYAPNLFSYIKMNVDNKSENGQYWLTGSQKFHLMKATSESLAGRVGIIELNSLTYAETHGNSNPNYFDPANIEKRENININELFDCIYKGGMPRLYEQDNLNRRLYFEGYIKTYLERDVKNLIKVGNEYSFKKFLVSVASRTGEQLNLQTLSDDAGISVNTAKRWLSILVSSGIVYLLQPYMSSELKRITHLPKIIFMDTGLCAYLAGWDSATELKEDSASGHYLETYVISEIIKSYHAVGEEPKISYYRDKEKNEIDLIFTKNNKIYPFEIKKTSSPNESMIKNFKKLESQSKEVAPGGIICLFEELMHLDSKNYIIPISSVINI